MRVFCVLNWDLVKILLLTYSIHKFPKVYIEDNIEIPQPL